jgi:hypothetical protein
MVRKAILYVLTFATFAFTASATAIQTYNTKTSFEAALASVSNTIDLDSTVTVINSEKSFATSSGYTDSGVQFVGVNGPDYFLSVTYFNHIETNWGSKTIMRLPYGYGDASYTTVTTLQPVTAFGFDAMTSVPFGGKFVISFPAEFNVAPLTFTTSAIAGTRTWIGFTTDAPFTAFQIQTLGGAKGMIDNIEFGQVQESPVEAPEVASLLMMGTGLLFIRFAPRGFRTLTH